jgi:tetratricopeptide (TPR) repeat protein
MKRNALALAVALWAGLSPSASHAQDQWATLDRESVSLFRAGQIDRALALGLRALDVAEQTRGPDHLDVAQSARNLGVMYHALGRHGEAEPFFTRALAIIERVSGPDEPDVATTLHMLAVLYRAQGDYARARPHFERSLAIRERAFGSIDSSVAESVDAGEGMSEHQTAARCFRHNVGDGFCLAVASRCHHRG